MKEDIIITANMNINLANDELQDVNKQMIQFHDAAKVAVDKSRKQQKQAVELIRIIGNGEKRFSVLQNKLTTKIQQADKLKNEIDTLKQKKANAEMNAKNLKEVFAGAQKMMKEAQALVKDEVQKKAASIKKLESDNEKLRKEIDKLKAAAAQGEGAKKTGSTLEDKMRLEEHKQQLNFLYKAGQEERKKNDKNDRLRSIVGGGGGLFSTNGSFSGALGAFGDAVKRDSEKKKKKKKSGRSSRRDRYESSSSDSDDSSVSSSSDRSYRKRRKSKKKTKRSHSRGRSRHRSRSDDDSSFSSDNYHQKKHRRGGGRKRNEKSRSRSNSREQKSRSRSKDHGRPKNGKMSPSGLAGHEKENTAVPALSTKTTETIPLSKNLNRNLLGSFSTPATSSLNTGVQPITQFSQLNDNGWYPHEEEFLNSPEVRGVCLDDCLTPDTIQYLRGLTDTVNYEMERTVQIMALKNIPNKSGTTEKRWKIAISDGKNFLHGMLDTRLNAMFDTYAIKKYTMIILKTISMISLPSKRRIFILHDALFRSHYDRQIGKPLELGDPERAGINMEATTPHAGEGTTPHFGEGATHADESTLHDDESTSHAG